MDPRLREFMPIAQTSQESVSHNLDIIFLTVHMHTVQYIAYFFVQGDRDTSKQKLSS